MRPESCSAGGARVLVGFSQHSFKWSVSCADGTLWPLCSLFRSRRRALHHSGTRAGWSETDSRSAADSGPLDCALAGAGDVHHGDLVYAHGHRLIVSPASLGHTTGTSQPGAYQSRAVSDYVRHGSGGKAVYKDAVQPLLAEQIGYDEAWNRGIQPIRAFMLKQMRDKDLELFLELSHSPKPAQVEQVPTHVIIPAFILSELRISFQIGFLIYIPFLIVDMVVASVLMSMGMMLLPPVMISLPFKLILFVLADGWYLVVGSMVKSFQ